MAKKLSIKHFMIKQVDLEEAYIRRDIRNSKKYLSNMEDMKHMIRKASIEDLENMLKKDPTVFAAYEEACSLSEMSYEQWEAIQIKKEQEIAESQGELNE